MYTSHIKRISSAPDFVVAEVIPDEQSFIKQLKYFNAKQRRANICLPSVNGSTINLYRLYSSVVQLGGYSAVTDAKLWTKIATDLHYPSMCSNVGIALRRLYFQYLIGFENELHPHLNSELNRNSILEDGREHSIDRYSISSVDKILGILNPQSIITSYGMHRSSSLLNLTNSSIKDSLHIQSQFLQTIQNVSGYEGTIAHPENAYSLRCLAALETAEKSLMSGLPNEVDLSLNSILFLSALAQSSNATPLRLSHTNNLLPLILALVGIFDDGPASLRPLSNTWRKSSSLNFDRFWRIIVGDSQYNELAEDSQLFEEESKVFSGEKIPAECPFVHSTADVDLFVGNSPILFDSSEPTCDSCLSRVLVVATLFVNLLTPSSFSSPTNACLLPQPEEDDDDLEQAVVFAFASKYRSESSSYGNPNRSSASSRSLLPGHPPPLSSCRDNIRYFSSSPAAVRFTFLCAHSRHSDLRKLGLQLVGSLRYKLSSTPSTNATVSTIPRSLDLSTTYFTRLGKISIRFLCRCLLESYDRCDVLSGLHFLTNLLRVPDCVNVDLLFTSLPVCTWQRLIHFLSLPDLGLVCAALETLYCTTGMGLLACTRLWHALALADDAVSARAPNIVFTVRHASIHLRPLLALLSLEGQSMGTGSLHRVKVMQRNPSQFQPIAQPIIHLPQWQVNSVSPTSRPIPPRLGLMNPLPPSFTSKHNAIPAFPDNRISQAQSCSASRQQGVPTLSTIQLNSGQSYSSSLCSSPSAAIVPRPPSLPTTQLVRPIAPATFSPNACSHARAFCSSLVNLLDSITTNSSMSASLSIPIQSNGFKSIKTSPSRICEAVSVKIDDSATNVNSPPSGTVRISPSPTAVNLDQSSLSELTDRLQMPPPLLPPPSALRRSLKGQQLFSSPPRQLSQSENTPPPKPSGDSSNLISLNGSSKTVNLLPNHDSKLPHANDEFLPRCEISSPRSQSTPVSKCSTNPATISPICITDDLPSATAVLQTDESIESPVISSTSLLEEVLNSSSAKSQLSFSQPSPTNLKQPLLNGNLSTVEVGSMYKMSGGNGIKKEILVDLIKPHVSADPKDLERLKYLRPLVNGNDCSNLPLKRPKFSDSSSSSHPSVKKNFLTNGVSSAEKEISNQVSIPVASNKYREINCSQAPSFGFTRKLKYNKRGNYYFSYVKPRFAIQNRVSPSSWQFRPSSSSSAVVQRRDSEFPSSAEEQSNPSAALHHSSDSCLPARTPFVCEWDSCFQQFSSTSQISCHVYNHHFRSLLSDQKSGIRTRRCCLWQNCPSPTIFRAPYALVGHVLDQHCSLAELQSRSTVVGGFDKPPTHQTSSLLLPTSNSRQSNQYFDLSGSAIIKEVEMRRFQSELLCSQVGVGQNAHRAVNTGRSVPFVPNVALPPREGPVTKHLRVTAALILKNLVSHVPEARRWLASETPLLCEIAMGACPGSSSLRTNDSGRIIAQCLALCSEEPSEQIPACPFRRFSHSVDLDA